MAQPDPYVPNHEFLTDAATLPTFPGAEIDVEFNAIEETFDQVLTNLALIQRDDGRLQNGIVDYDALDPLLLAGGIYPVSVWATGTAYLAHQVVVHSGSMYQCLLSHRSGTFSIDLAAVKWLLLVDLGGAIITSVGSASVGSVLTSTGVGLTPAFSPTVSLGVAPRTGAQLTLSGSIYSSKTDPTMLVGPVAFSWPTTPPTPYPAGHYLTTTWTSASTVSSVTLLIDNIINAGAPAGGSSAISAGTLNFSNTALVDPSGVFGYMNNAATVVSPVGGGVWGCIRGYTNGGYVDGVRSVSEAEAGHHPATGLRIWNSAATNAFKKGVFVDSAVDYGVIVGPDGTHFTAAPVVPTNPFAFFDASSVKRFFVSSTGLITVSQPALSNTLTDGLLLQNSTAAAAGVQQFSPGIHFSGQGWKTNATAASQTVDFIQLLEPVQGAANPSGALVWASQINGGGYTAQMALTSNNGLGLGVVPNTGANPGDLTVSRSGGASGFVYFGNGSSAFFGFDGTNWDFSTGGIYFAAAATAGTILRASGGVFVPSTATYPDTVTVNRLLWASATNVVSDLATANSSILVTSVGGVPSLSSTLPAFTLGGSVSGGGQTITNLASVAVRDTSAAFDVTVAATSSSALTAGRTLTLDMGNAANTLKFTGTSTITFPSGTKTLVDTTVTTLSSLTSVGTIGTGVWQGTVVAGLYGGTGLSTAAIGDLIYASATTPTWARLADVATGSVLVSGGANTAPAWSAAITVTTSVTTASLTGTSVTTGLTSPIHVGGSSTSQTLEFRTSSGNDTTGASKFIFTGGNNGTTEIARLGLSGASTGAQLLVGVTTAQTNMLAAFKGAGTGISYIGQNPSATSMTGLWMGASLTPSGTNYTILGDGTNTYFGTAGAAGVMIFSSGATQAIEVNGSGGVCIGTSNTDPGASNLIVQGGAGLGTNATATSFLTLAAGTTARSALRFIQGAAPTSPVDGDMWREDNTNTGLKIRIGGVTKTVSVV